MDSSEFQQQTITSHSVAYMNYKVNKPTKRFFFQGRVMVKLRKNLHEYIVTLRLPTASKRSFMYSTWILLLYKCPTVTVLGGQMSFQNSPHWILPSLFQSRIHSWKPFSADKLQWKAFYLRIRNVTAWLFPSRIMQVRPSSTFIIQVIWMFTLWQKYLDKKRSFLGKCPLIDPANAKRILKSLVDSHGFFSFYFTIWIKKQRSVN
jgi:hypothetical protein